MAKFVKHFPLNGPGNGSDWRVNRFRAFSLSLFLVFFRTFTVSYTMVTQALTSNSLYLISYLVSPGSVPAV